MHTLDRDNSHFERTYTISIENHSTGPRTPEGKAASARNALKHGLCATIITGQAAEQLALLEAALTEEFDPQTVVEALLIHDLAEAQWRKDRSMYIEYCAIDTYPADAKNLRLALRYRTGIERAFYKALSELRKIQAERQAQAEQFVSQNEIEPLEPVVEASAIKPAEPGLRRAALIYVRHIGKSTPFRPSDHSIPFTVAQIKAYLVSSDTPEDLAA